MFDPHRKTHPSWRGARHERALLRLVEGPGIVPIVGGSGADVLTLHGDGSLADLLAERGVLGEAAARGTGTSVARTAARLHADGIVHGDIKPANVVFAPDGDFWLIDFDAAGISHSLRRRGTPGRLRPTATLHESDDVIAIAIMVVECATGAVLDPASTWGVSALEQVGCSRDLAADISLVLATAPSATRVGAILQRRDDRLPTPPRRRDSTDPTPTVDIPSVAIAGLSPRGAAAELR